MRSALRLFAIFAIFAVTSIAWLVLGGVMSSRSSTQNGELRAKVADLWGQPQAQAGPALSFEWSAPREVVRTETTNGVERQVRERALQAMTQDVSVASTRIDVDLHLDQRLKGLVWYSLYDVGFRGAWSYVHTIKESGTLRVRFRFPDPQGVYDAFTFAIDGKPQELHPKDGLLDAAVPVAPGQRVEIAIAYKSRGLDEWRYVPDPGVASLKDFRLTMTTDFADIDFPSSTLSPSMRERSGDGYRLEWRFEQVVTGHSIGMATPKRV